MSKLLRKIFLHNNNFTQNNFQVIFNDEIECNENATTRGMRREDRARFLDMLHKKYWDPR